MTGRLFPDYKQVEREYFQQTGIFPIMHVTVIKQEIVDKYPWAAVSLVKAFEKPKQVCYQRVVNPKIVPPRVVFHQWNEERRFWARSMGLRVGGERKNLGPLCVIAVNGADRQRNAYRRAIRRYRSGRRRRRRRSLLIWSGDGFR